MFGKDSATQERTGQFERETTDQRGLQKLRRRKSYFGHQTEEGGQKEALTSVRFHGFGMIDERKRPTKSRSLGGIRQQGAGRPGLQHKKKKQEEAG